MAQRFKIDCNLVDDRRTLTAILAQNGYDRKTEDSVQFADGLCYRRRARC